jgi:hypothetical protein
MAITPRLSNTTMIGTLARMLDRMADVIGAQTMDTIAALMWESIAASITTGTGCPSIIMVRLTGQRLGITMVRLTNHNPTC